MSRIFLYFSIFIALLLPVVSFSFTDEESVGAIFKGEVLEIIEEGEYPDYLGGEPVKTQRLIVRDSKTGEIIEVFNDYKSVSVGNKVFYGIDIYGDEEYQNFLVGVSKLKEVIILASFFILIVIIFAGLKGLRSLLSLGIGFLAIIYILIPLLLKGVNPLIVGPVISFLILFFAIFFSYGFNRVSSVAFLGTSITVVITSLMAFGAIFFFSLSGFTDESSLYLRILSDNPINLVNLLTAGIIIGVLGVLDDIAVTQTAVVRELYLSNEKISRGEVYKSAIRVGQDHVSALVNTLVLAYVGVALPVMMIFKLSGGPFESVMSQEMVLAEIIRMIIGSIGVILAVPITTFLAASILGRDRSKLKEIEFHGGHSHSHIHNHEHNHDH